MNTLSIEEAKERLPLRELARSLGLEAPDRDGQTFQCWFAATRHANGNRRESMNIFRDRYRCFSCGAQGDGPDLLAEVLGINPVEAVREFKRRAGEIEAGAKREEVRPREVEHKPWPELREGTAEELERLARLRGLSVHGLALAQGMGVLRFGRVCGRDAWLVTDESGRVAEARRMDGKLFPAFKTTPARKPHCLPGSTKKRPCGLMPTHSNPALFRRLLLVEGDPDLLAAYHFAETLGALTWLPVAMLGRAIRIEPEALALFKGRHVRIVPHMDADGGGEAAARTWGEELRGAGATVDFFRIPEGLRRRDGRPVKDLCDAANLPDRDRDKIADLFFVP